jgi:Tfp pilus assembly protein PilX
MMARARNERGSAVIVALLVMLITLAIGLTLLAVVDTQTRQTGVQRTDDAAFNLAEGVLNAQAIALSNAWPTVAQPSDPPSCTNETGSTLGCPDPAGPPLAGTYSTSGHDGARWQTWVEGSEGDLTDGVWVRAQATVRGRSRAVAARVHAKSVPALLPENYGVLTGRLSSGLGLGTIVSQLTSGGVLGLVTGLLGNQGLISSTDGSLPNVGVRCGLAGVCLAGGLFSAVDATGLGGLLNANHFVQYGSANAASDAEIAQFRRTAQQEGAYVPTVAAGESCIPRTVADPESKIVFVEQVAGGASCTVSAGDQTQMLVVATGGVQVTGKGTFTGVIYALNRGAAGDHGTANVSIGRHASVTGAVMVDGSKGEVDFDRKFDVGGLIDQLGVCKIPLIGPITCAILRGLGVDQLLDELLGLLGVDTIVNGLLHQITPAIIYDPARIAAVENAVKLHGQAGAVMSTFREVPPRPAGAHAG